MPNKHLSSQFDIELANVCKRLLTMGRMVYEQITYAMHTLHQLDAIDLKKALIDEQQINHCELEIDEICHQIIALRQPAAYDLRLLIAILKMTGNLERVGDEALKIIRSNRDIAKASKNSNQFNLLSEISAIGDLAKIILNQSLAAFENMNISAAKQILLDDFVLDKEFKILVREIISQMKEETCSIAVGLDYISIAKAVERIGDHAKNIAEFVVYIVQGADIRHRAYTEANNSS